MMRFTNSLHPTSSALVDDMRSDRGTVHIAALVIKRAIEELNSFLSDYTEEHQEAIYITYYKQGPNYISRFKNSLAKNPHRRLYPGKGCRVGLQREQFLNILGIH